MAATADTQSVYELFAQALRRERRPLEKPGRLFEDEGVSVRFAVEVRESIVCAVDYRCSTCVVLVAVCERLSRMTHGMRCADVCSMETADIASGIPAVRQGRAALALRALRAALPLSWQG